MQPSCLGQLHLELRSGLDSVPSLLSVFGRLGIHVRAQLRAVELPKGDSETLRVAGS